MRRSNAHPSVITRAALLFTAVLAGSDCTGTPLPEPPDELPRPDFDPREAAPVALMDPPPPPPTEVQIKPQSGAVAPGARVWAVNLDVAAPEPVEVLANELGGFLLKIPADDKQRVRLIARTDQQHSPPLDLVVTRVPAMPPYPEVLVASALGDTRLACLSLTPPETVVLRGSRGELTLHNQCAGKVTLDEARLLFGTEGIALEMHATTLLPGKQIKLTFTDSRGPGASERLDILLLEVSTPGLSGRYAVDIFSALK